MGKLKYKGYHILLTPELVKGGWKARAVVETSNCGKKLNIFVHDHCLRFGSHQEALEGSQQLGVSFVDREMIPRSSDGASPFRENA